jgi:hypothetical protein
MKREYLPMDSIDRAGMMLGICIIGLCGSVGIWALVKFCHWIFT